VKSKYRLLESTVRCRKIRWLVYGTPTGWPSDEIN